MQTWLIILHQRSRYTSYILASILSARHGVLNLLIDAELSALHLIPILEWSKTIRITHITISLILFLLALGFSIPLFHWSSWPLFPFWIELQSCLLLFWTQALKQLCGPLTYFRRCFASIAQCKRGIQLIEIKYCEDTRPQNQLSTAQEQHRDFCKFHQGASTTLHAILLGVGGTNTPHSSLSIKWV